MLSIVEICSLDDPLLLPWLDLYETAFPPGERLLVSRLLNVLHEQARGKRGSHLLAAVITGEEVLSAAAPSADALSIGVAPGSALAGILFDYEPAGSEAAFLWYFAVNPQMRGQGLGSQIYRCLLERLDPQVRALIFDLEDPAEMATPEERALAKRRIAFYRRLGARLLGGIEYIQTVGPHQPRLPMLLMAHAIQEISPREAFNLAQAVFGEEILKQVGEIRWAED